MAAKFKTVIGFFRDTFSNWGDNTPSRLAAALAYRGIFSLVPVLLVTVSIVGIFFGNEAAQEEIAVILEDLIGADAAGLVVAAISTTSLENSSDRLVVYLITLGTVLYAASGLFNELKNSLNSIWKVPPSATKGILNIVKNRAIAVVMVIGVGVFVLFLMILNVVSQILVTYFVFENMITVVSLLATFAAITLVIALIFKFVPDVTVAWSDVGIGAVVTALLLSLGIWAISIFLAFSNVGSAYGAAGTLFVILIWIYYSAQIFLYGAKFTHGYASRFGSKIVPDGVKTQPTDKSTVTA